MALSSHLGLRLLSVSSAPLALSTLFPTRLQDQKTVGSKYTPDSFHWLFPESPERCKKVEVHVCAHADTGAHTRYTLKNKTLKFFSCL